MKKRLKYKKARRVFLTVLKITFVIVAACIAIKLGVAGGNLLYNSDKAIIASVDVDNYRSALEKSLPIIDTIYNSGTSSSSFSGQLKGIVKDTFHFDLESPITILNAQLPIFSNYYENGYQKLLAQRNASEQTQFSFSETVKEQDKEDQYAEPVMSSIYIDESEERKLTDDDAVSIGKIAINNETKLKIEVDNIMKEPLKLDFSKKGPQVLIFHTHTTESYLKDTSEIDKKNIPNRTNDNRWNVVRVGEELAQNLRKDYGIEVIHNATVHDYPGTTGAYGRSLSTVSNIIKSYPSIKIVIDLHRDALDEGKKLRTVTEVKGKKTAKVMFVMGTNATGLEHPNWKENMKLAITLQNKLNEKYPGLARPIFVSPNRFNQHLSKGAMIIEVGGDGNTISECLESAKYLAEAIGEVVNNK